MILKKNAGPIYEKFDLLKSFHIKYYLIAGKNMSPIDFDFT